MRRALEIPIEVTGLSRAQAAIRALGSAVAQAQARGPAAMMAGGDVQGGLFLANRLGIQAARARRDAEREWERFVATIGRGGGGGGAGGGGAGGGGGRGPAARLASLLYSTRLNLGSASPLVGRLMSAAGVPAGPAGLVVGGGVAALAGFITAMRQATATVDAFGQAMRLTGGTAADVAGIRRFGGEPGAAGAFRQRIATDPMAMMFAAGLGVRALPRPFGGTNEAALMQRAERQIAAMTNAEERLRYERELGLENVERYVNLSPALNNILDINQKNAEQLGKNAAAANELTIASEQLTVAWQNLTAPAAARGMGAIARNFESLAALLQGQGLGRALEILGGGAPDQADATRENTKALDKNTQAIGAYLQPGQYGGGPYSRAAMPGMWSGDYLARQAEQGALSRGIPVH